jgi:oxygen-dependent protoporphyrinogen oxidase
MSRLVDGLAATLPQGVDALGSEVRRLTADSVWHAALPDRLLRVRAVVLAVPAHAAARLLAAVNPDLAARCRTIRYVSSATVTLAFPADSVSRTPTGLGFVAARGRSSGRLLAASWVTSKWPARSPAGTWMVRAFVGGAFDQAVLDLDDVDLVSLCVRELMPLVGLQARPRLTRVFRWPLASPQYDVGHLDLVGQIEHAQARSPGLFLTGSAYRGVGIPDTVADARAVAAKVCAWLDGSSSRPSRG